MSPFPKKLHSLVPTARLFNSDSVVASADEAAGVARFVSILAACAPDPLLTSAERKTNLWLQSRDRRRRNRLRVRAAAPASGGHLVKNPAARTWIRAGGARQRSTSPVAQPPAAEVRAAPSSRQRERGRTRRQRLTECESSVALRKPWELQLFTWDIVSGL